MSRDERAHAASFAAGLQVEEALRAINLSDWREIQIAGNQAFVALAHYLRSLAAGARLTIPAPAALAEGEEASRNSLSRAYDDFGRMCVVAATAAKHRHKA